MPDGAIERYQLAGFDDRGRGFNRPVECEPTGVGFRVVLRYETARVAAEHPSSATGALEDLVRTLHQQGYRELRSQLSFKQGLYLGSQELWVQYPDPVSEQESIHWIWHKLRHWMQRAVAVR
ncbi:MAG: hypothetical protein AB7G68_04895 [Nitrospiraceae bacterium]